MDTEPTDEATQDPNVLRHPRPWSEADYFALPTDSPQRTELIDGSLLVSMSPDVQDQQIAYRLTRELEAALPDTLEALPGANVRLATKTIMIPDVVVFPTDVDRLVLEATAVLLLAEVVSPTSKTMDRFIKPKLYAEAGVPWYLRVERHEGLELTLYRRRDEETCEVHGKAGQGESLTLPDFDCSIEVDALTRRRG